MDRRGGREKSDRLGQRAWDGGRRETGVREVGEGGRPRGPVREAGYGIGVLMIVRENATVSPNDLHESERIGPVVRARGRGATTRQNLWRLVYSSVRKRAMPFTTASGIVAVGDACSASLRMTRSFIVHWHV